MHVIRDKAARSARIDPRLGAALVLLALVLACAIGASRAHADDELPGRVGRIADVQGPLYHAPPESADEWSEIGINDPVAQGDNLWVARDGRAEIDYGGGEIRLAGDTNVHVSRLDERQLSLYVAAGRVIVRVRVLEAEDEVRLDTPTTQITLTRPGLYRLDVVPDIEQTTLVVREGEAQVATATATERVLPGQTAVLTGTTDVMADIFNGGGIDGFDAWSAARDRVYERPRENAYVSRQMVGEADLYTYGRWQTYGEYGAVWFPTVDPEWAPYRFGHWTWLPGWGYTWVDDAPWGYAPFHYGRWVYVAGRWGWCPGAYVARPLWAPALVAWYGGAGWSHSVSFGAPLFGWVPLGWREPFVPWWRGCGSGCWSRYNRPYAVSGAERRAAPPTHFANWTVPGGITAVPGAALTGGKPVAVNRVPIGAGASYAPSLVVAPPAVKPAPFKPGAVRPGGSVPAPASASRATRAPIAPIPPAGRIVVTPGAAGGPAVPSVPPATPRSPTRAVEPRAPAVGTSRPTPAPRERAVAPPPPAPVERAQGATRAPVPAPLPSRPVAPVAPERTIRPPPSAGSLPAPPTRGPSAPVPAIRVVPAPVPAPQPVPVAPPGPRAVPVPLPQGGVPQPVPHAAPAPAPHAPAERAPVHVAPPNPGATDRPG